jgi:hypothetical protein
MRQALMTCVALAGAAALAGCGDKNTQTTTQSAVAVAEAPAPAAAQSPGAQQDAVDFWTPAKMRSATPIDTLVVEGKPERDGDPNLPTESGGGPPASAPGTTTGGGPPSGSVPGTPAPIQSTSKGFGYRKFFWGGNPRNLPASSIGRLFFKGPKGNSLYSCSGAMVAATNGSLVWTAGHCLYDPEQRGYSRSIIFVPGFANWKAPFGVWSARTAVVLVGWQRGSHRYDLGAVVLARKDGSTAESVVGAQGIRWRATGRPLIDDFGYPGEGKYDGRRLVVCEGRVSGKAYPDKDVEPDAPAVIGIGCDMTQGSSGGPWISELRTARGWGYVSSVNSFRYNGDAGVIYGPYHGKGAKNLYDYSEKR